MFFTYSKREIDSTYNHLKKIFGRLWDRVSALEQDNLKNAVTCIQVKLDEYGVRPTKAHATDAGFDLYSPITITRSDVIQSWYEKRNLVIATGVHLNIPEGFVGLILPRSSLALKGIPALTGVIDAGYQGEIKITYPLPDLFMHMNAKTRNKDREVPSKHMQIGDTNIFNKGDRIAQIVILPIPCIALTQVNTFDETSERGSNGFGSSGK